MFELFIIFYDNYVFFMRHPVGGFIDLSVVVASIHKHLQQRQRYLWYLSSSQLKL